MQAQLRRRARAVEAVHVELAVIGKVGHVPAGVLADALRPGIAGQRDLVHIALHGTVERTRDEQPVPGFVDMQQCRAGAGAVDDVPVARGELSQQLAVIVVQVEVGVAAAFGTPDELRPGLEKAQLIVKIDPGIAALRQQDAGFAAAGMHFQQFQRPLVA